MARVRPTTSATREQAAGFPAVTQAESAEVREEAPRATEAAAFTRQYHMNRVGMVWEERAQAEADSMVTSIPTDPRMQGYRERANRVRERKANRRNPRSTRTARKEKFKRLHERKDKRQQLNMAVSQLSATLKEAGERTSQGVWKEGWQL